MTFLDLIPLLANESYTVFQDKTILEQYFVHWENKILILDEQGAKEWARYFDTNVSSKAETARQIQEHIRNTVDEEQVECFYDFIEALHKPEDYLLDKWKVLDLNFGFEERV